MNLEINETIKSLLKELNEVQTESRNINVIGNHFDIVINNYKQGEDEVEPHLSDEESIIVSELTTVFCEEKEAVHFLSRVKNMSGLQITNVVNEYVKSKKIHKGAQKGELYAIMKKYGLYHNSRSNWNNMVDS